MKKQKGFTLIELLVVIAIIGILTAIGIASFTRAQKKARDARRMADLEALEDALQLYYSDNNEYLNSSGWDTINQAWLDNTLNEPDPNVYMKRVPTDPIPGTSTPYGYNDENVINGSAQCYCLRAQLELHTGADDTTCSTGLGSNHNYGRACP